jgi:hypothetical protein
VKVSARIERKLLLGTVRRHAYYDAGYTQAKDIMPSDMAAFVNMPPTVLITLSVVLEAELNRRAAVATSAVVM